MSYTNFYDCAPIFTLQQGQDMRNFLYNHPTLAGVEVLGTANVFQQPSTHGLFLSEAGAVVGYARTGVHSIGGGAAQEPSSFRNLFAGIYSGYTAAGGYSEVVDSKFTGCNLGIWGYGSSMDIDGNTFSEGCIPFSPNYPSTNPNLTPIPDQFGVFLGSSTPLLVFDGNRFAHDDNSCFSPGLNTVGSYIQNIGDFNHHLIYNQYTDLDYGNIADGANASNGINGPKGLHYLCNTNNGSQRYDFAVTQGGSIRREQGLYGGTGDLFLPAGNAFSYSGASNDLSDFNNQGTGINYYYNPSAVNEEPLDYFGLVNKPVPLPSNCSFRERTPVSELTTTDLQQIKNDYYADRALYSQAIAERNQAANAGNTALAEQKTLRLWAAKISQYFCLPFVFHTFRDDG